MKSTHSRLSLSRFSLNSTLKRHKRTNSLPEPQVLLKSSSESVASACPSVEVCNTVGAIEETMATSFCVHSDDEAGGGGGVSGVGGVGGGGGGGGGGRGKRSSSGSAMKLERYCSQLGLSKSEKVLKVFPCFMVTELLIQGVLIITDKHVCFYSKMFGLRRSKKIKFEDIEQVGKEKVYALFPTGISLKTSAEKVTFSSATSRDKLLKLLRERCCKFPCELGSGSQGSHTELEASITGSIEMTTQSPNTISSDLLASEEENEIQTQPPPKVLLVEDASVKIAPAGIQELDSIASWESRAQITETNNSQPMSHLATANAVNADNSFTCNSIVLSKTALGVITIILVFCPLFIYAFYLNCWLGEIEHQILMKGSTTSTQIQG